MPKLDFCILVETVIQHCDCSRLQENVVWSISLNKSGICKKRVAVWICKPTYKWEIARLLSFSGYLQNRDVFFLLFIKLADVKFDFSPT